MSVTSASFRPRPSAPRRFSAGMRTSWNLSEPVLDAAVAGELAAVDDLDARRLHAPRRRPRSASSRLPADRRASAPCTTSRSATGPFVHQSFWPCEHPACRPGRAARVRMLCGVAAHLRLGQRERRERPGGEPRQPALLLCLRAEQHERRGDADGLVARTARWPCCAAGARQGHGPAVARRRSRGPRSRGEAQAERADLVEPRQRAGGRRPSRSTRSGSISRRAPGPAARRNGSVRARSCRPPGGRAGRGPARTRPRNRSAANEGRVRAAFARVLGHGPRPGAA